jgi:hypothetical protein
MLISQYWEKRIEVVTKICTEVGWKELDRDFWSSKAAAILSLVVDMYKWSGRRVKIIEKAISEMEHSLLETIHSTTPTRDGYYWYFRKPDVVPDVYKVARREDGELWFSLAGKIGWYPVKRMKGRWLGPISTPSVSSNKV